MREFEIRLRCVQDVQDFVDLATTKPFNIYVCDDTHQVSGKSFMEMFSLNLRHPVTVSLQCTQEEYDSFRKDIEAFLVK